MPLINSGVGKIKSILVIDDEPGKGTIALTRQLAIYSSAIIYHIAFKPIPTSLGRLPGNIRNLNVQLPPTIPKSATMLAILQHIPVADRIASVMPMANSKNSLLLDKDVFEQMGEPLITFLEDFSVKFSKLDDEFFLPAGDHIAANDFIIIGPQLREKRNATMGKCDYWQRFFKHYKYETKKPKVLELEWKKENDRCWNNVLYHLDLYLTFAGYENKRPLFFLAEIAKNSTHISVPNSITANAVSFLEDTRIQLENFFNGNVSIKTMPLYILNDQFPFTYNNALVEAVHRNNRYYMPHYIFSDVQDLGTQKAIMDARYECKTIVENSFGQVVPIDISDSHVMGGGGRQSLHCLAAVLKR